MSSRNESSVPIEDLVYRVSRNRLSLQEAINLVDQADISIHVDMDMGIMKPVGNIELMGTHIQFTTAGLFNLHRILYEDAEKDLEYAANTARLCLRAAERLRYGTGQCSFNNALVYIFEKIGDKKKAEEHYKASREVEMTIADQSQAFNTENLLKMLQSKGILNTAFLKSLASIGETRFIEAEVRQEMMEPNAQTIALQQELNQLVSDGEEDGDIDLQCIGWRGLALLRCDMGDPAGAVDFYERVVSCIRKYLGPIPLLIALGDQLWLALYAGDRKLAGRLAEDLGELSKNLPNSLACVDLLKRSAWLCNCIGAVSAGAKCLQSATRFIL